jgi:hypothetical protein
LEVETRLGPCHDQGIGNGERLVFEVVETWRRVRLRRKKRTRMRKKRNRMRKKRVR